MWRDILGLDKKPNSLVELLTPRRTFHDVVLPDETRQQLYEALTQIRKHSLIFQTWGLGERHPTGVGLAFNFAGPPGTGKTICAEAVAYTLGRKLLRVRYAELESCWAGETGKNIRTVFREAQTQNAVLFFDEADSIAARRFSNVQAGYEREANQAVNILLKELEEHEGVVIFATNMASNFDPAFERRIRTHILFRMPGPPERERIWKAQLHPSRTPLGKDVNFRELAERYEIAGGDIRNAVIKAAQMAAAGEGPDETKRILQHHFVQAIEQVVAAKRVMQQNAVEPQHGPAAWQAAIKATTQAAESRLQALDADLNTCRTELALLAEAQSSLGARMEGELNRARAGEAARLRDELATAREAHHLELTAGLDAVRRETSAALTHGLEAVRQQADAATAEALAQVEEWLAIATGRATSAEGKILARLEHETHMLTGRIDALAKGLQATRSHVAGTEQEVRSLRAELAGLRQSQEAALQAANQEHASELARVSSILTLEQETRLANSTLLPWSRGIASVLLIVLSLLVFGLGTWLGYALIGKGAG